MPNYSRSDVVLVRYPFSDRFCTETRTGRAIPARFEPLTPDDEAELRGDIWSAAIFTDV
jgi:hypothetical protein